MKVKVQSSLTEPINGLLEIECNPTTTTSSLIHLFCKKKGVELQPPNLSLYNSQYKPLKPGVTLDSQGITDGNIVHLGYRSEIDSLNIMLKWRVICLIFCILAVCGILTVCLLYTLSGGQIPFDYGIVMDAGSTHTQVTLYRWKGDKDEGTGEVVQIDTCKINNGIQEIKNVSEAGDTLLPCLKNLSASIPNNQISTTPVYLGATAGMRLLKLTDPHLVDDILLYIHYTLLSNGYDVKNVDIISGSTEGLFAWITTNFLSEKLECEEKKVSTLGTLDLGGASTQIAYEIEDRKEFDNDTIITLTLYGNKYDIFSKSYLCFGINEAIRRYYAILVGDPNRTDTNIDDPCGLRGHDLNYSANFLFNQPCTKTKESENWLTSDDYYANKTYIFTGLGDSKQCLKAVGSMMDVENCQKSYTYCFNSLHQPLTNVKFMAISTYYYLAKFLKIDLINSTMEQYEIAMNIFCNTTYEEALKIDPEEAAYVSNFCFEAHYILYLLTEEYGFNASSWKNIIFVNKIKKFNVGWSLGYMINATTLIPAEKPQPPMISVAVFVGTMTMCLILLVIAAILFVRYCNIMTETGYIRIEEA